MVLNEYRLFSFDNSTDWHDGIYLDTMGNGNKSKAEINTKDCVNMYDTNIGVY